MAAAEVRVKGNELGLPDTFPEAYASRCLPLKDGSYDERVDSICWKAGYRRTGGPFFPIFYIGKKPSKSEQREIHEYWESHPIESIELVRKLAGLVGEEPSPEYLKLFEGKMETKTVEIPREDAEDILERIFKVQERLDKENKGGSQEDDEIYNLLHDISLILDSALEGV